MRNNSYLKDENKGNPLIIFYMLCYSFSDTLTVVLMLLSMITIVVELQCRRDTRKCNVYTSNAQHCTSHEIRAVHPAISVKSFNWNVPVKIIPISKKKKNYIHIYNESGEIFFSLSLSLFI